jgi:hypothetical protein
LDLLFMKKGFAPALVAFASVTLGVFWLRFFREPGGMQVRDLLPSETVFLLHVPDADSTLRRWKSTSLAEMADEPDVRSFLAKPLAALTQSAVFSEGLKAWLRIAPKEGFVAVATLAGTEPKGVAGLRFAGSQDRLAELQNRAKGRIKRSLPHAKTDLLTHGGADVEVLTFGAVTVASAFRDSWFFVGNDVELLKRTLDRCDGKPGLAASSLRANPLLDQVTQPLPKKPDVQVFGQLGAVFEWLATFQSAAGLPIDPERWAPLRKKQAFAAATKLEGKQFRDSFFVLEPELAPAGVLERHSLVLSSDSTLLYWAIQLGDSLRGSSSALESVPVWADAFVDFRKALAQRGLLPEDLGRVFGPELGVLVDWPAESNQPVLTLALDVRDPDRVRSLLDSVSDQNSGKGLWMREQRGSAWIYTLPASSGLTLATPVLGLTDGFLFFASSAAAADFPLSRPSAGQRGLGATPSFENASRLVVQPSGAYGYLDLRGAFERAYGTFRPFLAMALALAPETASYVDGSKLPGVDPIARHLSPAVFSSTNTGQGTLVEWVGPVAFSQFLFGSAGGALGASISNFNILRAKGGGEAEPLLPGNGPGTPADGRAGKAALKNSR